MGFEVGLVAVEGLEKGDRGRTRRPGATGRRGGRTFGGLETSISADEETGEADEGQDCGDGGGEEAEEAQVEEEMEHTRGRCGTERGGRSPQQGIVCGGEQRGSGRMDEEGGERVGDESAGVFSGERVGGGGSAGGGPVAGGNGSGERDCRARLRARAGGASMATMQN